MSSRILLIDGVCNLCNGIVHFVIDRDPTAEFSFAPLQSDYARELLRSLGHEPIADTLDTFVLIEDGIYYDRSTAAFRVLRRLKTPLRLFAVLRFLPRAWRDGIYDLVAKHRYRLFGRSDVCRVPLPAQRRRFLA